IWSDCNFIWFYEWDFFKHPQTNRSFVEKLCFFSIGKNGMIVSCVNVFQTSRYHMIMPYEKGNKLFSFGRKHDFLIQFVYEVLQVKPFEAQQSTNSGLKIGHQHSCANSLS